MRRPQRAIREILVAILVAVAAISGGPALGADGAAPAAERVVRFPADRSLGIVWAARQAETPEFIFGDKWQRVGEARGDVRVPTGVLVRLDVSKAISSELIALDALDPEDLQAINLRQTDVSDDGLRHVGRLTGLRMLDVQDTRISDAGFRHLAGLTRLEYVDADAYQTHRQGFGIGDGAMDILSRCPNLTSIRLRRTKITDDGLAKLAQCKALWSVSIPGTAVSDAGLVHLKGLPKLEYLSLGVSREGANITDEGLKIVGQMVQLKNLGLSGTKVTNAGLKHLRALTRLQDLYFEDMDVTEAGLAELEPLTALRRLRFYVRGDITDAGAEHLSKLRSLRQITAFLNITDKGLASLVPLEHLESIELSDDGITDAGVQQIARMKSLKDLSFQGCPITDAGLSHLAVLENLEGLAIRGSRVTGEGLAVLTKLPKLERLWLGFPDRESPPLTGHPSLKYVGRVPTLKMLSVRGWGLTDQDFADLAGLLQLEDLTIECPINDEAAFHIAGLMGLKHLTIEAGGITDIGLKQFGQLHDLQSVSVSGHFTDQALPVLGNLKSLYRLRLGSPYLTEDALQALAARLPELVSAERLRSRGAIDEDVTFTEKDPIRRWGRKADRQTYDSMEDKPPPTLKVMGWLNAGESGLDLGQLKGKVVLVDFWGTWCGPCVAGMPKLKHLHERYADQGLVIVGIHTTSQAETMPEFVTKESIAWPMAADMDKATVKAWNVQYYPSMFLIDRAGNVRIVSPYRGDLERAVVMLLREPEAK